MLQRVPVILAVTASSYGLSFEAMRARRPEAAGARRRGGRDKALSDGKPTTHR
ncbi:MAG: hypothetical protein JWQ76_137 [Ramlibacter sp.]|nr:hypothetical protein [Ramlibacter sp.]